MVTIANRTNASILVTGRGASRICKVSHPTFHKWVREGTVTPLGWIESERGNSIPVFERHYIERYAAERQATQAA